MPQKENIEYKIVALIATSMNRTDFLMNRSLKSVLSQSIIPDIILVVDDNTEESVCQMNKELIGELNDERIVHLRNSRARQMSGTGAWNTGLDWIAENVPELSYTAILDDDDEWLSSYIEECIMQIDVLKSFPDAVFAWLKRGDLPEPSRFIVDDISEQNFLIGNPGIQGSNMFFKSSSINAIGGFDENLASSTDRDIMIRFIEEYGSQNISVIPKKLINHYTGHQTVTGNHDKKRLGLDSFYGKHIYRYSLKDLKISLQRAQKFFCYPNERMILELYRKNKPVLVTGACGFIGSHLARKLIVEGYRVVAIDDMSNGTFDNIQDLLKNPSFSFHSLSILDEDGLNSLFLEHMFSIVFHLAALPRVSYSFDHPEKSFIVNVDGTETISRISMKYKVDRIVYASSSSVYGNYSDGASMKEDGLKIPASPYAEQKLLSEQLLNKMAMDSRTSVVNLRLFNVYGYTAQAITEYSTVIPKWISSILKNEDIIINNSGRQSRDFTYINDVVDAFVLASQFISNRQTTTINIGCENNISIEDIASKLGKLMGVEVSYVQGSTSYDEPMYTLADNRMAKEVLGWSPVVSIDEGLKRTVSKASINSETQKIVIGVAMHNSESTIRRCISSILSQKNLLRELHILIVNDASYDNWYNAIQDLIETNVHRLHIVDVNHKDVILTRNFINSYIQDNFQNVSLIGRLDSDDEYATDKVLRKVEKAFDDDKPDLLLAGNYLRQNEVIIERVNRATHKLAQKEYLIDRLRMMSEGIPEAELPSCNLFITPHSIKEYPRVNSGEDHSLLVHYLLNSENYSISFLESVLLTVYNLNGTITHQNKQSSMYLDARKNLLESVQEYE